MKKAILGLSALCVLSWYGLWNKYQDNEDLNTRLQMVEFNNSMLYRQNKQLIGQE